MTKEKMEDIMDIRFKEITSQYEKYKIVLFKSSNDIQEQLEQDDVRWTQFCEEIFTKGSMPNKIFESIQESLNFIEEFSLIWYEEKISQKQLDEFMEKATIIICPINGLITFIFNNKRWKKSKIHIFKLS